MPSAARVSSRAARLSAFSVHAESPTVRVHAKPLAVVWERTGSRPAGWGPRRSRSAARRRCAPNAATPRPILREIGESSVEPLQLLLVAVGALSAIFGELRDAIAIFSIIVLVSSVEAISEVRAKRALQALRDLSTPHALVRRAGAAVAVPVGALVVGDVLLVEAGSVVAADARVVEADGGGHRRVQADGRARLGREGARAGGRRGTAGRAVLGAVRRHPRWWPAPARAWLSRWVTRPRSGASGGWSQRPRNRLPPSSARWLSWRAQR